MMSGMTLAHTHSFDGRGIAVSQAIQTLPGATLVRVCSLAARTHPRGARRKTGEAVISEIHFMVEEAPDGGFIARAIGVDIYTEADDVTCLHAQVSDAVHCHFPEGAEPPLIRLHLTRAENEDAGNQGA